MKSRAEILRAHYLGLLKKAAIWSGMVAMVGTLFVALPVNAAQITSRSATLSDSTPSSTTDNVKFSFTFGSSYTVRGILFQVCNSPLQTTACTVPTGATFASASSTLGTTGGTACASGWIFSSQSATDYKVTDSTGVAVTSSGTCTITVNGLHNPTTAHGTEFYLRITTFTDTGFSLPGVNGQDFGAMAVSTNDQVTVSANVQESLTFCVYDVSGTCAGGVTTSVPLGTGTDNVLSANAPSGGQSKMDAATNATTGYVISYLANNLTSSSDTITAAGAGGGTGTAFSAGTALFGINIASANTVTGTTSGGISGSGSGQAVNANYTNNDKVAFVPAAVTPLANSNSSPTLSNTYTVSYLAQAGSTTKPGSFTTTFTYVCTGTF